MTSEKVNEKKKAVKKFMSVQEYADYRGISSAAVYKRIREGAFPRENDGSIDVANADANYYKNASRVRMTGTRADEAGIAAGANPNESALDDKMKLIRERAKKEGLAAEREEINVAKLRGSVVDKQAVESLVFTVAKQNSESWLNWPNTISVELASELDVDPSLLHSLLLKYIREHLETSRLDIDIESIAQG